MIYPKETTEVEESEDRQQEQGVFSIAKPEGVDGRDGCPAAGTESYETPVPFRLETGDIKKLLEQLFDFSGKPGPAEDDVEKRVDQIIRSFLTATTVSSNVDIAILKERFRASRIPRRPLEIRAYLDHLAENVVNHSINMASPKWIGHMTAGLPYFVRPLSKLLTTLNQNVVKVETSKSFTPYERQALAMMHRLVYNLSDEFYNEHIQHNDSTLGIITSGGTLANITALWCARNSALKSDDFPGVEKAGWASALEHYGYKRAVIIGSSLMHYSFEKSADILGIGTQGLIRVPVDSQHRIDLQALRRVIADCRTKKHYIMALVGIAGTTDSGAIDPLSEMAEIAQQEGIPFHVDAAWGGPLLFSERHKHKLRGIERAHSVTIDGHKQMYLPMGLGIVLLRNPHAARSIEKQARYIVRAGSDDLGRRTLEGSRSAVSLFLHAALHIIGCQGYEYLIDKNMRAVQYMAELIKSRTEFELLTEPEMNILLYRYIPAYLRSKVKQGRLTTSDNEIIGQANQEIQRIQRRAGKSFVSRTTINMTNGDNSIPVIALRVVIANLGTTEADIASVLEEQVVIGNG